MRRVLEEAGYRVVEARQPLDAVRTAREAAPHLLLTDVVMPGMQGREVPERVGAVQPGIGVRYMSGYTQGVLDAQGVLRPGINLIEKPFSSPSLLRKVRLILDRRGHDVTAE
jgi:DNA-binding response OmpR family regulator